MLFSTTTTAIITVVACIAPCVSAGWINDLRPRASGTSSCTVVECPAHDTSGHALIGTGDTSDLVLCYYPAPYIGAPDDFCKYNKSDGLLYDDGDYGQCPPSALIIDCSQNAKRAIATKRQRVAAKPRPAAAPVNRRNLKSLRKAKIAARGHQLAATDDQ